MSRLLPFKSETTHKPDGTTVLSLEDEATEEALSALSSDTAREILSLVYEEPMTPPEIRDEIESSLQNVHYHLENLEEADLIQPAGSGYSEKGTEMTVYAPASEAVVLFAGRERDRSRLKTALTRLLGAVGLLALASVVVRRLAETRDVSETAFSANSDGDAGEGAGDGDGGIADGDGGDGVDVAGAENASGTPTATESGDDIGVMDAETTTQASFEGATETPTGTPLDTATPQATETVEPLGTSTPTPGPTGTPQPTPTADPTGTPTLTPAPTDAPTETPTAMETSTATPSPTPTDTPTAMETPTATSVPDPGTPVDPTVADEAVRVAGDGGLLSDPAVTFFLGGAFMLAVVGVWWYYGSG